MKQEKEKIVLAYSGGLDTSVAIAWLKNKGYDVIACCIDVGEGKDLEAIKADDLFGTQFTMDKAQRLDYGESLMTHAMVFQGVDLDDNGQPMECSADPMLQTLQQQLAGIKLGQPDTVEGKLDAILSNPVVFGCDLTALGLGDKIESMVKELVAGPGAVRATLQRHLS